MSERSERIMYQRAARMPETSVREVQAMSERSERIMYQRAARMPETSVREVEA
ncbi:hypothetical protein [Nocardia sp. NPDC050793]|uniref:hypothetical protein n=1 Tax=Nocardia sp. NPDC050793 TaxID=3155159 RepID=UPI0033EDD606